MKICKRCCREKEEVSFRKVSRNTGGLNHVCRDCEKQIRKEREYDVKRRERPGYKSYNDARNKVYSQSINGRARYLFNGAKSRAAEKNLEFSISFELVKVYLTIGHCQRTGIKFDLTSQKDRKRRNPYAPSLDRVDSSKGYTVENVRMVCDMYNHGKGMHSDEEFIKFCHIVAQRNPLP